MIDPKIRNTPNTSGSEATIAIYMTIQQAIIIAIHLCQRFLFTSATCGCLFLEFNSSLSNSLLKFVNSALLKSTMSNDSTVGT